MKRTKAATLLHTVIDQELDQVQAQVELSRTELHQQVDLFTPDKRAHKGPLPWPRGQVVDPKTGGPMPAA